ncbi:MAG: CBS domain-containing protein [Planctomycetaceae bacterium]
MQIQVRNVMDSRPDCLPETTTVDTAVRVLIENDVRQLYVVDTENRLLGVLTDFELLQAQMNTLPCSQSVTAHMNCELTTISPNLPIARLASRFRESRQSTAAVVEDDRLVGHIDRRSIVQLIAMLETFDTDDTLPPNTPQPHQNDTATTAVTGPQFLRQKHRVRV